jgi:serralysin
MKCLTYFGIVAALLYLMIGADSARASFHLWKFDEAFSNADGSVQFIEMINSFDAEEFVGGQQLKSNGNTFTVPTNLPSASTSNHDMLFATAGFGSLPGGVTPDYIIPAHFFNPAGDTLNWASGFDIQSTGQVPIDGLHSRILPGTGTAINSPTNFAGASGSVLLAPEPTGAVLFTLGALIVAASRGVRNMHCKRT